MSENPTLRRGDEGVDGWVEYLQTLLRVHGYSGHQPEDGIFDEITEQWVISYQRYHQPPLKDDGIVGDQTWSALRDEPELQPVGSDGREPHTYTEHGVELRFTTEMEYLPYDDMVWCRERTTASLSAIRACRGNSSQKSIPGTVVLIG